jgi:hypothetical protein
VVPSLIEEMRALHDSVHSAPIVDNQDNSHNERTLCRQEFMWDGSFHLVPQDFQFCSGDVQNTGVVAILPVIIRLADFSNLMTCPRLI